MIDFATGLGDGFLSHAEWGVLGYLANAVWQVPLVFAAAWAAARLARRASAAVEHRVWVLALLLEVGLPAAEVDLRPGWDWVVALFAGQSGRHGEVVRVVVSQGTVKATSGLRLPATVLAGLAAIFAISALYFAARLVIGACRTDRMRRRAVAVVLEGEAAAAWRRHGGLSRCGLARASEIRVSGMVSGPVTVGVLRPAVLVPVGFIESVPGQDFEAVVAHEMAHVRRYDFAKNLAYEAISIAVAWHPVVWITRARVAESREMVCDAMAAEAVAGNESYARSLLRLAAMVADCWQARTLHAIGIFNANSFERRVMNLTKKRVEMKLAQRLVALAACAAMVVATCLAALALRVEVGPEVQAVAAAGAGADPLKVDQGNLKSAYKKPPVYPAEARARKNTIDGPVVLALIIGKDGAVQQIKVKQSLREDYDRSALEAVKDWRWKPFLLNGEPVEVDTTVTVNYSLQPEDEVEPKPAAADAAGAGDGPPKIIRQVDAEYPQNARANKSTLNGAVIVGVTLGSDGSVKETHIEHGLRADYDASAQEAVRKYRFEPAHAGGKPVAAKIQVEVDFKVY